MPEHATFARPAVRWTPCCQVESLEDRRLFATVLAVDGKALIAFDSAAPQQVLSRLSIKKLLNRETIAAIDFQPSTGRLYALSSTNRLYRIDPTTGIATNAVTSGNQLPQGPTGPDFGFDVSPLANEIRIIRNANLHTLYSGVDSGTVTATTKTAPIYADSQLSNQPPDLAAIAHSFTAGAPATSTVYGIDRRLGNLVTIGSASGTPDSPDTGLLNVVGSLGQASVTGAVAFDIAGADNQALLGLHPGGRARTQLLQVDLTTGATTSLGDIGKARRAIVDFAVVPTGTPIVTTDGKTIQITDSNLPNLPLFKSAKISGLASAEKILFITCQPADNVVFAYTNQLRLYTLNVQTAQATAVGQTADYVLAKGERLAGDFDPVRSTLRIVSSSGDNFRIQVTDAAVIDADPVTEGVQLDNELNYPATDPNTGTAPVITGVAYTQSIPNASFTSPFAIDQNLDLLATISSPDGELPTTAELFDQGDLGVDIQQAVGFDIATGDDLTTNTGYLSYQGKGGYFLTTVDLNTGATTEPLKFPKGWKPVAMTAYEVDN